MSFALSDEQEELARIVRRFLEDRSGSAEVRRLMETDEGYDPAVWCKMAGELGLQSLHLPERYGGQGYSFVELAVVLEEQGRALLCAPYFASVCLAADAILNAGSEEQKARLLPGIASGETVATLALDEENDRSDPAAVATEARPAGGDFRLWGTKTFVLDGCAADLLVVAARRADAPEPEGLCLFAVDAGAEGVTRRRLTTLDATRRQARIDFAGAPAELLGDPASGGAALSRTLDQAAAGLAAEMAGGARRCLEMSVDYAKERHQFGVPIGSFQAIKHLCAELLLEVEQATAVAYHAAGAAAGDDPEFPVVASLAKAYCSDVYTHVTAETIQIHGGIGFTWEHEAHLYFRRARSSAVLLGDATTHRERLAARVIGA